MLTLKKFMVIPLVMAFLITSQVAPYKGFASSELDMNIRPSIYSYQIIKEYNGIKLAKAIYDDKITVKDIIIFNNGTIEEYNEKKHSKYFTENKLSKNLSDKMLQLNAIDKMTVALWIDDIDYNYIDKYVKDKLISDDSYNSNNPVKLFSFSQKYTEEKRKKAKEEYIINNSKFISESLASEDILFVSQYSPLIITSVTSGTINELTKNTKVKKADIFVNRKKTEDVATGVPNTKAKYVRDTLNLKGNGVKVGILEAGYPDKSNAQLTNATINFDISDLEASRRVSSHATMVTSIIVGKDDGIAPSASAYVASASNRIGDYQKIEWLISQGVDIINYSAGYSDIKGVYSDMAKWIDHISMQHNVIFVKSAGNIRLADTAISDPGMAYNAFVVGSMNDNNSSNEPYWNDDLFSDSFSCYTETSGGFKPDLTAPGEGINVAGYTNNSGTSFSAPHVAGVLAQIIGAYPNLTSKNNTLKAISTAATLHKTATDYGTYSLAPYFSNKEGAGVIDALGIYNCISNSRYYTASLTESQFPYNRNINITANGQKTRVSLSWQVNNTITGPHTGNGITVRELSDLDLEVYDPYGNQVCYSMSANNNVELVQFTPTVSGTYTIKVSAYSLINNPEEICIAWDGVN